MVDVWRVKDRWSFALERVEADKVTDKSVFIKGTRAAKSSDGVRYFESFTEAKEYSEARLRRRITKAENEMNAAEMHLQQIEKMTEDTVPVSTRAY